MCHYDEAAKKLVDVINDERFASKKEKTRYTFWIDLCDLITQHPREIISIRVEPILRSGISKFKDQIGKLWTSLADYFSSMGHIDKVSCGNNRFIANTVGDRLATFTKRD